jgi:hypothetical protein
VSPPWLTRVETFGTTLVVLMVGAMMIWYEAVERERRLALTIGCAVVLYAGTLAVCGLRSRGGPSRRPAWSPGEWPS